MTLSEVMADLQAHGREATKRTLARHGAREPFFGVPVGHLKTLQRRLKKDHPLALQLYATGNTDAMYLAALVADPRQMTKAQLRAWARGAYWYMLSCFAVAWTAAESRYGRELAVEWMAAPTEQVQAAGWATYASLVSITPDNALDLDEIAGLLDQARDALPTAANRAKYAINNFIISVGGYVPPLLAAAKAVARQVGTVAVDVGDTDCRVPNALVYIEMLEAKGRIGRKRKSAAC